MKNFILRIKGSIPEDSSLIGSDQSWEDFVDEVMSLLYEIDDLVIEEIHLDD